MATDLTTIVRPIGPAAIRDYASLGTPAPAGSVIFGSQPQLGDQSNSSGATVKAYNELDTPGGMGFYIQTELPPLPDAVDASTVSQLTIRWRASATRPMMVGPGIANLDPTYPSVLVNEQCVQEATTSIQDFEAVFTFATGELDTYFAPMLRGGTPVMQMAAVPYEPGVDPRTSGDKVTFYDASYEVVWGGLVFGSISGSAGDVRRRFT